MAKEAIWLHLLLTKLGLLQPNYQYAFIKVSKNNKNAHAIYQGLEFEREEEHKSESKSNEYPIIISLKDINQGSIALAHNLVFYLRIKNINIQHNYICDKVVSKKIDLSYILINQMIANSFTKALTHMKFYDLIK